MARVALNIAKKYDDGFIEDIERTKYFQLHKNGATRAALYCFAIALCEMEGQEAKPIKDVPVKTFVRTEYLNDCEPLFSSLYFDKCIKDDPELIDEICDRDDVYGLMEDYANTGFGILESYINAPLDEETLMYKLITYMDKKYAKIIDEVSELMQP